MMKQALKQLVCIMAYALLVPACWSDWPSHKIIPDTYDDKFEDVQVLLPSGMHWTLLKAQCYQESKLRPFAISPVGAKGLCQFMPGTWREAKQHMDVYDVYNPEHSIVAAAWYMRRMNDIWISERPTQDRLKLAMASYNAGAGNIIKAQRRCNGQLLYEQIIECLPQITGRHSEETIDYVHKIVYIWWPQIKE